MRVRLEYIGLAVVVASALFFKGYQLDKRLAFGWDQERDAQVMWQILKEGKPTLIGPRAVGPEAFFLGPLWYYLLVPFYALTNLDPMGAGVFGLVIGLVTTLTIYCVVRQISGAPEALVASWVWSTFPERLVWNPSLMSLLGLVMLWAGIKISQGKQRYIVWAWLVFGLGLQIHFQAVALIFPLLLAIYFYYLRTGRKPVKAMVAGIGLVGLTCLPLVAFDLRHGFINSKSFVNFFLMSKGLKDAGMLTLVGQVTNTLAKFLANASGLFLITGNISPVLLGLATLVVAVFGLLVSQLSRQVKVLSWLGIFGPLMMFSFYRGNISEYYFGLVNIPILIGCVLAFKLVWKRAKFGRLAVSVLLGALFWARLTNFLGMDYSESAYYKKQAVFYIAQQTLDPVFNVSYSTPVNADTGFRYLFKLVGKQPTNTPEGHLWTIVIPPEREGVRPVAVFGHMGVIRR